VIPGTTGETSAPPGTSPEPGPVVLPAAQPGAFSSTWTPGPATAADSGAVPSPAEATPGGFWRRVLASFIDSILLNILNLPFAILWVWGHAESMTGSELTPDMAPEQIAGILGGYLLAGTTGFLISWVYSAGLECSSAQATLGKMALGLKVTDGHLRRMSFGRASGRFFAKLASNLTFGIGYLVAAFTARKRALHDMIAGTLVIRG